MTNDEGVSSMFSMNLCDKDPSTSVRAVCFDEDVFDKVGANTTYEIESFKYGNAYLGVHVTSSIIQPPCWMTNTSNMAPCPDCTLECS